MKRIFLLAISAVLLAGCSVFAVTAPETGIDSISSVDTQTESISDQVCETSSADTQSETVVTKDSLSEQEIALLDTYLTAYEGDLTDLANFRAEPIFCGVYEQYTVAFCDYEPWGDIKDGVIESVFPYEPINVGVYLIDGQQVISLGQALADGIERSALEDMLPAKAVFALDRRPADTETLGRLESFFDGLRAEHGWREEDYRVYGEPMLLGTLGSYEIISYPLMSTYVSWEFRYVPDGWNEDCMARPKGTSRCGVYAVGEDILLLEDAVGTVLDLNEVYELLPMLSRCYLDMALEFPFAEGETITGVK